MALWFSQTALSDGLIVFSTGITIDLILNFGVVFVCAASGVVFGVKVCFRVRIVK
jgi:hypothetical protein